MADFGVIKKYDDPVGNWYVCSHCCADIFLPEEDVHGAVNMFYTYCPYCGEEIINVNYDEVKVNNIK